MTTVGNLDINGGYIIDDLKPYERVVAVRTVPFYCVQDGDGWYHACSTQCYRCAHRHDPEPVNPLVTTDFKMGEELLFDKDPTKVVNFLHYAADAKCCCVLANGSIALFNQNLLSRP